MVQLKHLRRGKKPFNSIKVVYWCLYCKAILQIHMKKELHM